MKKTFSLLLILVSLNASSQILAGLYSGTLFNDTTKMLQQYQLALSEYRGKITGYSYTTYVVNDTFYYGIRKVKASKQDGKLIVEDDKFITNNFPESPSKGVRRISVFELNPEEDTVRSLKGTWETNKTKLYYSVSGTSEAARNDDSTQSPLISHLKELKIISTPVYQDDKPAVAKNTNKQKDEKTRKDDIASTPEKKDDVITKPPIPAENTGAKNDGAAKEDKTVKEAVKETKATLPESKSTSTIAAEPDATAPTVERQGGITREKNDVKTKEVKVNTNSSNVLSYDRRVNKQIKFLEVSSDSLVLSFYDNGVVDGDMISVYLNGENVINNTKLTATAMKKTIYVKDIVGETIQLNLVAENLGSLPPNTGLLVVQDGDQKHQVHFSADLQTNATILFKKKQ